MKRQSIIFIFLLASISAWAQRDYRKGYVITNSQDTIYGWIDYRGDVRNSRTCSFKKSENDQATDFSPSDIMAYRFTDSKYYISRSVDNKQIFLEYLVNGIAKLYYYRDDRTSEHYYIEKEGDLIELKVDEKEVEVDGKTQIKTVKSYVGVLKATFNVWEMGKEIDRAKLDHESLINITKDYHKYACTDGSECIVYERKEPLLNLRIGPVVGGDLSTIRYMEKDKEKYDFDPASNFTFGVNLNIYIPRFNEKFFMQLQALYTRYYFFANYQEKGGSIDAHIRSNVLQMSLGIKYEYPKGRLRPTLAAGLAVIYMPGEIEKNIDTYYTYYNEIRSSTSDSDFPTKVLTGFVITPGLHYYLTPDSIIFMQLSYMRCYKREAVNFPANIIQSFGLSAGIYF